MTAAPTISQRSLSFRIPADVPLMTISFARGVLGCEEIEVLEMIEDGRIAWAWNVATDASSNRRELRLLAESVRDCKSGEAQTAELTELQAINKVLARAPHPFIKSTRLRRLLLCSSELIIDLIRASELKLVKDTTFGVGRYSAALITRESVMAFLKRRIV